MWPVAAAQRISRQEAPPAGISPPRCDPDLLLTNGAGAGPQREKCFQRGARAKLFGQRTRASERRLLVALAAGLADLAPAAGRALACISRPA
jgi:hypothetical protein